MSLGLPTTVRDPRVQQCLDFIASRFPIKASSLADSAKELFPQLVTPGPTEVAFGQGTLKWSAAAEKMASEILTVNHSMERTPTSVVGLFFASEASETILALRVIEGSLTSTQFKIRGYGAVTIAKSTEVKFMWIAIG